jgi:5,10-methylene-tetrahydrofolate dehydrogenase/methenyl tetrahydrofolate cyclohydrolase
MWGYADSDPNSARLRLQRLGDRPLYITQEQSVADIEKYLKDSKVNATLRALPYPNHTDEWVLKDIPERAELREWLSKVLAE